MKKTNRYVLWGMTQSTLIHIFLMSIALTCLFPIFWMIRCAFMTNQTVFVDKALIPHHLDFGNFAIAWTKGNFAVYFLNSIIYTVCVVTGIVLISSLAAFGCVTLERPPKRPGGAAWPVWIPPPRSCPPKAPICSRLSAR